MSRVAFLLLLIFCSSAFAQSKKELKKFNIKSCTVTVTAIDSSTGKEKIFTDSYNAYDKNGKMTEEKEYDRNGNFRKHECHKYNKNGSETEWTVFDAKGNIIRKTVTDYNSNNDKKTESIFDGTGTLIEKTQFNYNAEGVKTS
ncbi:MAG: hypothetical protein JJE25_12205, partial [Bacteroidia bacterium]|nr:hypothetical protein [Bacteroidia bacterium]